MRQRPYLVRPRPGGLPPAAGVGWDVVDTRDGVVVGVFGPEVLRALADDLATRLNRTIARGNRQRDEQTP